MPVAMASVTARSFAARRGKLFVTAIVARRARSASRERVSDARFAVTTCCSGATAQCCRSGETSICIASESTCCADDSVCYALNYCDGDTAHRFNCVDSVCTETVQNCQGNDPCSTYRCDTGFCFEQHVTGCCTQDTQCQAVDSCTPADCLGNNTCNAVSNCFSDEHCCSGNCTSTLDRCCSVDGDCADLDFCSDETLDAYHYTCVGARLHPPGKGLPGR